MNNVVCIDSERIKEPSGQDGQIERRGNVEFASGWEADRLCKATRYDHMEKREDYRAGGYERKLETKVGEVTLTVPKLRRQALRDGR